MGYTVIIKDKDGDITISMPDSSPEETGLRWDGYLAYLRAVAVYHHEKEIEVQRGKIATLGRWK